MGHPTSHDFCTLRCSRPSRYYSNFHSVHTRYKHRLSTQISLICFTYLSRPIVLFFRIVSSQLHISFSVSSYTENCRPHPLSSPLHRPLPPTIISFFNKPQSTQQTSLIHTSPTTNAGRPCFKPNFKRLSFLQRYIFRDFIGSMEFRSVGREMVVLVTTAKTSIIPHFYAVTSKTPSFLATMKRKSGLVIFGHGWNNSSLILSCRTTSTSGRVTHISVHFMFHEEKLLVPFISTTSLFCIIYSRIVHV